MVGRPSMPLERPCPGRSIATTPCSPPSPSICRRHMPALLPAACTSTRRRPRSRAGTTSGSVVGPLWGEWTARPPRVHGGAKHVLGGPVERALDVEREPGLGAFHLEGESDAAARAEPPEVPAQRLDVAQVLEHGRAQALRHLAQLAERLVDER